MRQHISLVLSSGGARGLAHIGAIEELESNGYEIHAVAGCSMGALIGGLYATGHLGEVTEWFRSLSLQEMMKLVDISLRSDALVKGEKIIRRLKEIVPDRNIEDLPIPFRCVATDFHHGRQVVFDHGSLYDAIRASISIPMIFYPVKYRDTELVDGGLLNPLPIDLAERHYGDKLVVVNVSAINESGEDGELLAPRRNQGKIEKMIAEKWSSSSNMLSMMLQTSNLMIQQNTALTLRCYAPDILVNLPMNRLSDFDYDRATELIELGREAMHNAL